MDIPSPRLDFLLEEKIETEPPTGPLKLHGQKNFPAKRDSHLHRLQANSRQVTLLFEGMGVGDHPLLGCREGVGFACCLLFDGSTHDTRLTRDIA
jgi:hypothetical protein